MPLRQFSARPKLDRTHAGMAAGAILGFRSTHVETRKHAHAVRGTTLDLRIA